MAADDEPGGLFSPGFPPRRRWRPANSADPIRRGLRIPGLCSTSHFALVRRSVVDEVGIYDLTSVFAC